MNRRNYLRTLSAMMATTFLGGCAAGGDKEKEVTAQAEEAKKKLDREILAAYEKE